MIKYRYEGPLYKKAQEHDIPIDLQVEMFRSMLRIRRIEEEIERRYKEDEMKSPIHLVIGQEAASVGPCTALRKTDFLLCGHRTHGAYLAKGGDLKAMMSELFCRSNGCAGSRGGSMHLFDPSVGMIGSSAICAGALPIATGAALTTQMRGEDRVVAVMFGDGASEEGVVWESLNFASLKKLPVVFLLENNFYSVCSPLDKREPQTEIYRKAESFGAKAILADGTNALECYAATKDAVDSVRRDGGPAFVEMRVYRWRAHGGAGDDSQSGYRDIEERKAWEELCPVEGLYRSLRQAGHITDDVRERLELEFKAEIQEAFEHARSSPVPEEKDLYTHVYAP